MSNEYWAKVAIRNAVNNRVIKGYKNNKSTKYYKNYINSSCTENYRNGTEYKSWLVSVQVYKIYTEIAENTEVVKLVTSLQNLQSLKNSTRQWESIYKSILQKWQLTVLIEMQCNGGLQLSREILCFTNEINDIMPVEWLL